MTKARLLWIDLEMTGLDPAIDKIVEVGVIATDFDFNQIATYQATVQVDDQFMRQRMVGDFWDKNDQTRQALLERNGSTTAKPAEVVSSELVNLIKANFDLDQPIYLAGNSIHQDQKFIERAWPALNKMLSYRMLDVSAWKIIFENSGIKFTKPELHRAMSDIEGSIDELKYYLTYINFTKRGHGKWII